VLPERVVAFITRYAVRLDPVDRITFYSGDRPWPSLPFGLILLLNCAPTTTQRIDFSTIRKVHNRNCRRSCR
jgi:hypothetical protein